MGIFSSNTDKKRYLGVVLYKITHNKLHFVSFCNDFVQFA